jgi:hypothetical protein
MNRLTAAVNALDPEQRDTALANFIKLNPHYDGAHWDDVLAILLDADAHLDLTEECDSLEEQVQAVTKYWEQEDYRLMKMEIPDG